MDNYLKDATKTHTRNVEAQYSTEEFFYDNSFEDYVEILGKHRKKQQIADSRVIESLFDFYLQTYGDEDTGVIIGQELHRLFLEYSFSEFRQCIVKIVESPVFNSYSIDRTNGNQLMSSFQTVDTYDFMDSSSDNLFTGIFFVYSMQYCTDGNGVKHLRVRGKEINDDYELMLLSSTLHE